MAARKPGRLRRRLKASARRHPNRNLAERLVAAAMALLAIIPPQALSLRSVAKAAGVSEAAPYHHFADKRALEAAVMAEGYRQLATMLEATAVEGPDALNAVLRAYVAFALSQPNLFRLMRRESAAEDAPPDPALAEAQQRAFAVFHASLAATLGHPLPLADARLAWSALRATVATLVVGGTTEPDAIVRFMEAALPAGVDALAPGAQEIIPGISASRGSGTTRPAAG